MKVRGLIGEAVEEGDEVNQFVDAEDVGEGRHGRVLRLEVIAEPDHRDLVILRNEVIRIHDRSGVIVARPCGVDVAAELDDEALFEFDRREFRRARAVALMAALLDEDNLAGLIGKEEKKEENKKFLFSFSLL